MSALFAILSFLAVVTGFAAAYRVWERRSPTQPSPKATSSPESNPPIANSPAVPVEDPTPHLPPIPTATVTSAPPTPMPSPVATAPMIPDPWLNDEAVSTPVAQPELTLPISVTPPAVGETMDQAALSEAIARIGRSGQLQQVPYLSRYLNSSHSSIRAAAATALGNLAINRRGTAVEAMIPLLGKLCQDSNPDVRCAAVAALGNIQSAKVLPLLQQAQKQPDRRVSKAAANALQTLKLIYQPKPMTAPKSAARDPKKPH